MLTIDWANEDSHILLNPRLPDKQREAYASAWRRLMTELPPAQVALATSGSTARPDSPLGKLVVLGKEALLASAAAVNRHLTAVREDVWVKTIPDFHVGGLGILVRAHLTGSRVVEALPADGKWDANRFAACVRECEGTLCSLVPSQVFDLVQAGLEAPPTLRAIVVGAGALSEDLYKKARALGWPVLGSYGLTECASQVATADLDSLEEPSASTPSLAILPHFEARIEDDGRIALRGPALLTGYIEFWGGPERDTSGATASFRDPKVDGWYATEDRGRVRGRILEVFGRGQDFFKIGGESVALGRLENIFMQALLETEFPEDAVLLPVPDERLGTVIHLMTTSRSPAAVEALCASYHQRVLPFEKIRAVHKVDEIPRSPLKKLLRSQALALIGFQG